MNQNLITPCSKNSNGLCLEVVYLHLYFKSSPHVWQFSMQILWNHQSLGGGFWYHTMSPWVISVATWEVSATTGGLDSCHRCRWRISYQVALKMTRKHQESINVLIERSEWWSWWWIDESLNHWCIDVLLGPHHLCVLAQFLRFRGLVWSVSVWIWKSLDLSKPSRLSLGIRIFRRIALTHTPCSNWLWFWSKPLGNLRCSLAKLDYQLIIRTLDAQ